MRQFLARSTPLGHLKSIEVYGEDEDVQLGVAVDTAKAEGFNVEVYVGLDLVDVVGSHKSSFEERA